jgi:hypothetical protein
MKLQLKTGTTSKRLGISIADASSNVGAGLTGLVYNSSGLTWYYWREDEGNAGGTSVTLATATRGTWSSGGFVEKDATNLPGEYEIGIPDAALAAGAKWVKMVLKGAANMVPVLIEIQLVAFNPDSATDLGLSTLTGNVPQTGDSYARIGATGSGLSSLAPAATALSTAQWTNARAALLDYLDALISSRAPASTALSTAQWTNARAALLDYLDAAISSRLASASYTAPDNADIAAIKAKTDSLAFTVAGKVDANTLLVEGSDATDQIRDSIVSDATRFPGARIDATISSRLAGSSYTAPDNADIVSILAIVTAALDATISSRAPASTALSTAQWTNTRAALLDYLDAAVSSRAPSATALSTAQWTNARAALLDLLDAAISSRLAAGDYTAPDNADIASILSIVGTALDATISSRAPASTALSTVQWTNARAAFLDLLNSYLDAAISSRLADSDYTAPDNADITSILAIVSVALDVTLSSRAPASTALSTTQWTNARAAFLDLLNSFLDAAVSSRLAAAAYTAPDNAGIAALQSAAFYQAKLTLTDDNSGSHDVYTVVWFKNGQPVTAGITSPTIQVVQVDDGADLVAADAMSQIGSLGLYKYVENSNRVADGSAYVAKVTAVIDGSPRTWFQPVSRDS